MENLSSRSNPRYRQWLVQAKYAGKPGHSVWLEGVHLCQAWLEHGGGQPQWALFAQEQLGQAEIQALVAQLDPDQCIGLPGKLLAGLSTLVSPPAVIFISSPMTSIEGLLPAKTLDADKLGQSCILLDEVQDPGNVGTLLRIAAASGIKTVFTSPGTAACWSPKVLRAGQGAQFALNIHEQVNLVSVVKQWRSQTNGGQVLATALQADATSIYEVPLDGAIAWMFGNEGRGVAPELLATADQCVYIPHDSEAVESLNVASAAAVCLFEQRRQHLASQ
ncbi:MAG: RNA methyltransferase [Burkholderiaceae bacterium]|nr:RNA methyltransferase [Burkholderiaceae bacterium]MCD8518008.1 RNA methyltransferase [Burkholderiaceae bacterium]MCD8537344.1 RNA methyltransferase [Burkholderiaceae bacterium]MCD8564333.1 RNA methyltransferase [Burkholderiaceae bacterium]